MESKIERLKKKATELQARIRAEKVAERTRRKRAVMLAAIKAGAAEIEADPAELAAAIERALSEVRAAKSHVDSRTGSPSEFSQ